MPTKFLTQCCAIIWIVSATQLTLFSQKLSDKQASPEAVKLFNNLDKLTQKGIMFGHQDDLAYGIGWKYVEGQSDVKRVCGDYPALYGWELGHLELGHSCSLDSVPFDAIRKFIIGVHAKGGVNTVSWHFDNPLTGGSAWDCKGNDVVKSVLPGGSKHDLFLTWLDRFAVFIASLKDEQGKLIPVLFRPLHENSGSWFWWGYNQCTATEYVQLYHMMSDYLRRDKQLHNLIIVYSPADNFETLSQYLDRYPGDDYVDIVGFDCYQNTNSVKASFISAFSDRLKMLSEFAKSKGKLATLSEMGYETIPDSKWWTDVLWAGLKDQKISYVLLWRNAWDKPHHFYVPYPGQVSEENFKTFYNLPGTLFLKDVSAEKLYQ